MRIFDTRTRGIRELKPVVEGQIGIYVCGPTVQSEPHIGHLRSALVYDLFTRWFEANGKIVTLIRNVTDIDDKVLEKAQESKTPWWQLAHTNELLFASDYRKLMIRNPSYEPRATGHIPQMLSLIALLVERGHAYRALDGSSSVYFDVRSFPGYGSLTNQPIDEIEVESIGSGKKQPQDFALWKAAKNTEPDTAKWESDYGPGRPGWHLECSAMATHYLGAHFDIHGGGLDLRFPHHENELAQSSAAGHGFANYWVHNGLVNIAGQKMSKSLNNSVYSKELFSLAEPRVVRYYLMSAHYRSVLDFAPEVLEEAKTALERIYGFLERAERELGATRFQQPEPDMNLPDEFVSEMNEDLNIPAALAVIHEAVRSGNTHLDEQRLREASQHRTQLYKMLEILGLAPSQWLAASSAEHQALDLLIQSLIVERNAARESRDYARADAIRDSLIQAGIELSDATNQTHWSFS